MANNNGDEIIKDIQGTLHNIKIHMRRLYELMGKGVDEGRVAAADIRNLAKHMGSHDSWIEDNDRNLRDLMGTVDIIKKQLQKLTRKETPANDLQMEETCIVQPVHGPGEMKK